MQIKELERDKILIERNKEHAVEKKAHESQDADARLERVRTQYTKSYGQEPTKQQLEDMIAFLDRCNHKLKFK